MWYGEKIGFRELDGFIERVEQGDPLIVGEIESLFGMDVSQYMTFDLTQAVGAENVQFRVHPRLRVKAVDLIVEERRVQSMSDLLGTETTAPDIFTDDLPIEQNPFAEPKVDEDPFESAESVPFDANRDSALLDAVEESATETFLVAMEDLLEEKMKRAQPELIV